MKCGPSKYLIIEFVFKLKKKGHLRRTKINIRMRIKERNKNDNDRHLSIQNIDYLLHLIEIKFHQSLNHFASRK